MPKAVLRFGLFVCIFAACVSAEISVKKALKNAESIHDSNYVTVEGSSLYLNGTRVRFWSAIGALPPDWKGKGDIDPYVSNQRTVEHLKDRGFNMVRLWKVKEIAERQNYTYKKGDKSPLDIMDHFIHILSKEGFKIWFAGAGGIYGTPSPQDVEQMKDKASAKIWKDVLENTSSKVERRILAKGVADVWNKDMQEVAIKKIEKLLNHVNQHSGLRYADDPVFAVWELSNEQWWMTNMKGGRWSKLPKFLRDDLIAQWHGYLKDRYGSNENLIEAWGFLLPGEDLQKGTILLAPQRETMDAVELNDGNPIAAEAFEGVKQEYGRGDFTRRRGEDVLRFFMGLLIDYKQKMAQVYKKQGKSSSKCPLIYDTGVGYDIHAQYIHQLADATSHDAYINGFKTTDTTHARYPFYTGLEEPPRICMHFPWLEAGSAPDKPFFCYETQIGSPAKYRTEFPYRLLFLASVQDWDIISWHYLGPIDYSQEKPFEGALSYPGPGQFQYHYTFDEVQASAMYVAGKIFTNTLLEAPASPTQFIYGKNSLYDPEAMDPTGSYGESGLHILPTTYRYGSRVGIDTTRETDTIIGPFVHGYGWIHPNPLKPTDQMTYNWNRGFLQMDAPGAAVFSGFLAQYPDDQVNFGNGVTIKNVSVNNPENSPYPVTDDEMYVSIGLTSTDGQPLASCKKAAISAVSTSFNTGVKVEHGEVVNNGTTPVLVTRVGCTIEAPALKGMKYVLRDWHMNEIGKGTIKDGTITISADQPVFLVELER